MKRTHILRKHGWKFFSLVILAAISFAWLIKAPLIASYLTDKLKIPISLTSVSIWPTQTSIKIFKVLNPRGFKTRTAFRAASMTISYDLKGVIGDPADVQEVDIDGIFLSVEFSNPLGSKNNWTAIGSRIPPMSHGKGILIHKLVLSDLTVEIRGLGLATAPKQIHIDRLEFDHIDSAKGFPTKELIQNIFSQVGIEEYIKDAFNPEKTIERVLNPFNFGGNR